jgi:hypothetical protein
MYARSSAPEQRLSSGIGTKRSLLCGPGLTYDRLCMRGRLSPARPAKSRGPNVQAQVADRAPAIVRALDDGLGRN